MAQPLVAAGTGLRRRILVDLTPVQPGGANGGAKLVALSVLRGLRHLEPDWDLVLLGRTSNLDYLATLLPGVLCLAVTDDLGTGQVAGDLPRLPDGSTADLLFCPFTGVVRTWPGVPTLVVVHDLQYAFYPEFFAPEDFAERAANLEAVLRSADGLITVSDYVKGTIAERTGYPSGKVVRIYNNLADRLPDIDADRRATVLQRHGLRAGGYLIYPANPWRHKNHPMLLTAFGMALKDLPDGFRLVLTGAHAGDAGAALQAAVERMGLADRVLLPGYVSEEELAALVGESCALVFPSLYEGFGIPVLEAMARGVPVLCSDVTSLPEVAGGAALLFDPRRPGAMAAAMVRVAGDPGLRADLARKGRARAADFGSERDMARAYRDLFARTMAEHRRLAALLQRELRQATRGLVRWLKESNAPPVWRVRHLVRNHLIRRQGGAGVAGDRTLGLFPDGWASDRVEFVVNRPTDRSLLRLELECPASYPLKRLDVIVFPPRVGSLAKRFSLSPGESRTVDVRLADGENRVILKFGPSFRPVDWNMGPDSRYITCLCRGSVL